MARSIWSGFLSFGLVSVPIGLYPATADQTIHFNQLHKGTSHRIRYKKVDEVTGAEVPNSDIVSGYDLGGGEYVVVTREELKDIAPGKSETIEISDFVDLDQIDPVHFRQTYYLAPRGKGADRAYALLRQAMHETGKVGIATMILRDKEHLVAVRPGADVLILETMYFADEIRSPREELDTLPEDATFQGRELDVARKLVESLTVEWSPNDYHNTYRDRVAELIDRKREGRAIVVEAEKPKSNVIDLMAALEASVARMGEAGADAAGGQEEAPAGGRPAAGQTAGKPAAAGKRGAAGQPDLDGMTRAGLLARAAELDIAGRSRMSKPELLEAITAAGPPHRRSRKIS
jgi:DNA end-binding protein Ku